MNDLGKFQVASISVLPVEIKGDIVQPHSTSLICKAASLCAIVAQGLLLVLHWRCGAGDFEHKARSQVESWRSCSKSISRSR